MFVWLFIHASDPSKKVLCGFPERCKNVSLFLLLITDNTRPRERSICFFSFWDQHIVGCLKIVNEIYKLMNKWISELFIWTSCRSMLISQDLHQRFGENGNRKWLSRFLETNHCLEAGLELTLYIFMLLLSVTRGTLLDFSATCKNYWRKHPSKAIFSEVLN